MKIHLQRSETLKPHMFIVFDLVLVLRNLPLEVQQITSSHVRDVLTLLFTPFDQLAHVRSHLDVINVVYCAQSICESIQSRCNILTHQQPLSTLPKHNAPYLHDDSGLLEKVSFFVLQK